MTLRNPGDVIADRFAIVGVLGQGGHGVTYRAQDRKEGGEVALKELLLSRVADWKSVELFRREATVLQGLSHAGIPRYLAELEIIEDGVRQLFLAQSLAPGRPLDAKLRSGWRPTFDEVATLADRLLDVLDYLHTLSPPVVHRDLKPANVLVDGHGHVSLVDFGSVQERLRREGSFASTIAGTYGFMAPEQLHGRATAASDLYGLGVTLIFLLTRREPHDIPQKRLALDYRPLTNAPPALCGFIDRLVAPAPEDRFPSAAAARAHLAELSWPGRATPASPATPAPATSAPPQPQRKPLPLPRLLPNRPGHLHIDDDETLDIQVGPDPNRRAGWALVALAAFTLTLMGLVPFVPALIAVLLFSGLAVFHDGRARLRVAPDGQVRFQRFGAAWQRPPSALERLSTGEAPFTRLGCLELVSRGVTHRFGHHLTEADRQRILQFFHARLTRLGAPIHAAPTPRKAA